ncbi:MAG: recombinase family protein, partial [Lachnospiraceae bacterium]|nr:recombinase family protein [Lachnospiraceae bacterium]
MQWHMPIGYKVVDGKITVYEEHRKIVEEIFKDYDSGISTLRIAARLKAEGVCNAHDRAAWTHASIGKILENHNYLGTEYYPQIIDTELFGRVQKRREQVRAEKGRGSHRPGRDERILFGGIITCGECGETYSHIQPSNKKRNNGRTAKWKCKNYIYQNRLSCAGGFITDEQVKEVCISAINQIIQDRRRMKPPVTPQPEGTVSTEYRKIERRLEQAKARWKQYGSGHDTADQEQTNADTGQTEQVTGQTDIITLLYQRAQERYRTLEINDAGFRTDEMQEILADRSELTEFDEELYR